MTAQQRSQIENGPPVDFEIGGVKVYPATRGVAWYKLRYSEWGRENQFEGTVIVRRLDCPDREPPAAMTACKVNAVDRRIIQIDQDATGEVLYLSIGAQRHRGA